MKKSPIIDTLTRNHVTGGICTHGNRMRSLERQRRRQAIHSLQMGGQGR